MSFCQSEASVRRRCASRRNAATRAFAFGRSARDTACSTWGLVGVGGGGGADDDGCTVLRDAGAQSLADLRFDLAGHVGMLFEERLGVFATLTYALIAVGVPRTALAHNVALERHIENRA